MLRGYHYVASWLNDTKHRDFAANVGITFSTPEEFFLQQTPRAFVREFDPKAFLSIESATPAGASTLTKFTKGESTEMVLLVGSPGAGKSTYYWRVLGPLGYERVNQDILKSRDKCQKVAEQYLRDGKSVAVGESQSMFDVRCSMRPLRQPKRHGRGATSACYRKLHVDAFG